LRATWDIVCLDFYYFLFSQQIWNYSQVTVPAQNWFLEVLDHILFF
jgi:hypothetical protein